jgi:hypothetical protein
MSEIQDNTYPLTAAQSGMWFAQFLDPTNPSFWVAECLEIHGPMDPVLFKGSRAPVEQPLPRRTSRARRHRRPVPAAAAIPVTVPRSARISPHASTALRKKAREDAPS